MIKFSFLDDNSKNRNITIIYIKFKLKCDFVYSLVVLNKICNFGVAVVKFGRA